MKAVTLEDIKKVISKKQGDHLQKMQDELESLRSQKETPKQKIAKTRARQFGHKMGAFIEKRPGYHRSLCHKCRAYSHVNNSGMFWGSVIERECGVQE